MSANTDESESETSGPTLNNLNNTFSAAADFEQIQNQRQERKEQAIDGEVMQAEVESRTVDYGTIDVVGESIAVEQPLGVGRRARIAKQATTADERGDDLGQLDTILAMIDALNGATPDEFDQAFWDDLNDEALREAFGQLARQSSGGSQAGN